MRQGLFRFIIGHRVLVSLGLVAITAVFGYFATQVKFDNTIESYFLKDDLDGYNRFLDQFGSDEIIVVAFEDADIFTPENLDLVRYISDKLEAMPHVRRVLSLTASKIVYGDAEAVHFDPLYDEKLVAAGDLDTIERRALDDPIARGTIISRDTRKTAIIAEIDHIIGEFDYKVALLESVRKLLAEDARVNGKRFYVGGAAVLDDAVFRYTERDQTLFLPLVVLVTIAVILFLFRTALLAALPIGVVVLTAVWSYGLLALLGFSVNVITTILGPLLIAVGIADGIHVIADYRQELARAPVAKLDALERACTELFVPCLLTSLTTALGLLSLLSADLVPVREFGLVASVGVLFALVITFTLIPVILSLTPASTPRHAASRTDFAPWLAWLASWHKRKAIAVLIVCGVALVPALYALPRLEVGPNTLDYFKPGDPVRTQTEWIDANLGGTASLEFFIDAGQPGAFLQPELLRKIAALREYLRGIPGVTGAYSLVDLVESLNKAYHDGDQGEFRIPSSSAAIGQQLLLLEGSRDLESFVSSDYATGRVMTRVELRASQVLAERMPEMVAKARALLGRDVRVEPTGLVYLMNRMETYLLDSQMRSFLIAFAVITLCIIIMLRSIRLGLLAMIPNVLPVLFTLALMVPLGIPLDVGTIMIAGVALGLVVDDSIHFLSRLQQERGRGTHTAGAIHEAMGRAGRPIVYTSFVLALGFLVLSFASFNPVIHFGLLSAVVIALALVFDLVVLPAIAGFAI